MLCDVCGGSRFSLAFRGNLDNNREERFSQYAYFDDIYRCDNCGLLVQQQMLDPTQIERLLKDEKYLDETIGELNLSEKHLQFHQLEELMGRHVPLDQIRLLDVGANTGVFLNMMRRRTETLRGIEPSAEAAQAAREHFGLDVQTAVIAEADVPESTVDVITMFDVIEHLTAPSRDLSILAQKLAPGGHICITTHDAGIAYARLLGRNYPMFMYQHFFHFTPKTLGRLLEKCGFRVVAVDHFAKSWSLSYFDQIFQKKWPDSLLARGVHAALAPMLAVPFLASRRITWPVREFFLCVAQKV
jgi:2-polyprenyl-3-methyl-5-hydroxy-6-metoxy-1,4-benzoquinol methylase